MGHSRSLDFGYQPPDVVSGWVRRGEMTDGARPSWQRPAGIAEVGHASAA